MLDVPYKLASAAKLFILLTLAFSLGKSVLAQDQGIVKFLVDVDNGYFEIELNDTFLLKRYKDTLSVGEYDAKIWSPGYVVTPISFIIEKDKTTELYVQMAKNNDFIQYEEDYRLYRNQFHKNYTAPISLTLISAITTGAFMVRSYSLKKSITNDIDLYYKTPLTSEIDLIKTRIEATNKKYNFNRSAFYINGGLSLVLLGGSIWSILHFNQNYKEPVYSKDSPFKDKYSLQITPFGCSFALHI
jgi:hypothetical protein